MRTMKEKRFYLTDHYWCQIFVILCQTKLNTYMFGKKFQLATLLSSVNMVHCITLVEKHKMDIDILVLIYTSLLPGELTRRISQCVRMTCKFANIKTMDLILLCWEHQTVKKSLVPVCIATGGEKKKKKKKKKKKSDISYYKVMKKTNDKTEILTRVLCYQINIL